MYTHLAAVELQNKGKNAAAASQATIDGRAFTVSVLKPMCARWDIETYQTFAPLLDTRRLDATVDNVDWYENVLLLDYPLLVASTVKVNDTTLTLWDGVYANKSTADFGYRGRGRTPYFELVGLKNRNTWSPSAYGTLSLGYGDVLDAIEITGTWCHRTRYPVEGWRASGDTVQNNPLTSSATSITVADADGVSYDGTTPRFSPGMLLQIESEWLSLEAVDTATNILTVIRGVRGSTAASHVQNTVISVWTPEPDVQRALTLMCGYAYARRGVYEQFRVDTIGGFISKMPGDLSEEVRGILDNYTLRMFRGKAV